MLSPLIGFLLALLLVLIVSWIFVRADALRRRPACSASLQFVSASLYSLGHGGNDAQKTMGIIAVLLFSQGYLGGEFHVPFWVVLTCQAAMGARHAVRRLAHRPHHGLEDHPADADAGLLRRDRRRHHAVPGDLARHSGLDHPHHHRRHRRRRRGAAVSAVRWSVASNIVVAWVVTMPATALLGAALWAVCP